MNDYYNTDISNTVRQGNKTYRIRKHRGVPYITYKRKTRVLYRNLVGGAFINVGGTRIYFL